MVNPIKPTFTDAVTKFEAGSAVEPIIALQNSAQVFTVSGGGLTANLGLNINHAPEPAQPAMRNDPGLHT